MRVASFFAGIGGFDLGFQQAGHEIVFHCEIDEFCSSILEKHWPNVPKAKDVRQLVTPGSNIPSADIWTAGFPCQDVSVARGGPRAGLKGERSGLFYTFAELAIYHRPEVIILENVRGLLSSHGGRDFGIILQTLASVGYALGWRLLDSQYFGVPQSRSRLYVVGYYRNPIRAGQILFEPECSTGNTQKSQKSGKKTVSPFREITGDISKGPVVPKLAYCLAATSGRHTGTDWSRTYVSYPEGRVRRLTPLEAERLQGFPDGWTTLPVVNKKTEDSDSLRYAALGNAVSVPVARWLGERVAAVCESEHKIDEKDQALPQHVS